MFRKLLLLLLPALLAGAAMAQKRTIPFNGGALAFTESGRGKPLLLLHGGFQDGSMWAPQLAAYNKHFRVINIDLPGHGNSVSGKGRPDADSIILAVMDSLHLGKAAIVSLSFGSAIALEFASRHPERVERLVMASPGMQGWDEVQKIDTSTMSAFANMMNALERRDTVAAARLFVQTWYAGPMRRTAQLPTTLRSYGLATTLRNMRRHQVSGWPDFAKPYTHVRVGQVQLPVLLLVGTKDMVEVDRVAQWLVKALPQARLEYFAGAAHMLNLEQPAGFTASTLRFLLEK
ncbi:MAG: alpha/beta hydrolase [Chitinophagaceae bacterium]|nr:MAG: alpha/beta hydrolase [Chitinophagaceae bacterium]